jgi:hypothetical protein
VKARYLKIGLVAIAVVASSTLWYVLGRTPDVPVTSDGVLMVMTQRGGLCLEKDGTTVTCESSYRVYDNGSFTWHRAFTPGEMQELRSIIARTDFTSYGKNSNPACPSFADGIDLVLSFPAKHPGKEFTLCLLDIPKDDIGLRAIVKLLDKHAKQ